MNFNFPRYCKMSRVDYRNIDSDTKKNDFYRKSHLYNTWKNAIGVDVVRTWRNDTR